ncbi:hypothetical protein ADICYQ_4653 [Cyclobacterium qasimii M12-11B]|uniref:Uncharacterized protein n=1 Tax=Cyclobacterium qasimii M12-11B TaxID=641524 RepID=S7WHX3_9BACT|nr:hypothetical protein ADICYQ_4653 [Cyclobacterium qasimii M12-11B]
MGESIRLGAHYGGITVIILNRQIILPKNFIIVINEDE